MKDSLFIIDSVFAHAKTSSWHNESEIFDWDRENSENYSEVVLTDLTKIDLFSEKNKYGWLIEPPHFDSSQYNFAKKNFDKFDKIFTYSRELLDISPKFEYVPYGASWIHESERKIYPKTKLISIISSFKKITLSHNLRHKVIEKIKNIDVYGNGYYPIDNKLYGLKDYMFSIAIENQKIDYFFSEKILDCFMTGTIPIYFGCPSIHRFFNNDGILSFNTIPELEKILSEVVNADFYNQKIKAIEENFELAKKYIIADDLVYKKIKNKK